MTQTIEKGCENCKYWHKLKYGTSSFGPYDGSDDDEDYDDDEWED